jgi:hypothetical protein
MSEKFDMKLVIDTVTTPLLHARLSAAGSYRERASLLRSLAESALRGDLAGGSTNGVVTAGVGVDPAGAIGHVRSGPNRLPSIDASDIQERAPEYANEAPTLQGHDVDQIADAFGTFF